MYHQWNEWYGTIRYDMVWYHGPPSVSPGAHNFGSRTRGGRRQGKSTSVVPCKNFLLKISLVFIHVFCCYGVSCWLPYLCRDVYIPKVSTSPSHFERRRSPHPSSIAHRHAGVAIVTKNKKERGWVEWVE